METKKVTGKITDKKPYTGDSNNAPKGDFYIGQDKYACWDKPMFDGFNIGEDITFEYTEKINVVGDKTYTNRSITKTEYLLGDDNPDEEVVTEDSDEDQPSPDSVSHIYKIGNLEYELTLRLVQ